MQAKFSKYYTVISDNIKKLRTRKMLSQEAFAEIAGCSREYISRLENYHEVASLDFILNLSEIFCLQPDSFLRK